ncbi:MAG: citrate synthase [Deltaproteobacteria bacterium]|nr:citrate synthase [Deltaproteobacteria bacterium]
MGRGGPSRFDNPPPGWVGAREAAARLGVQPATLYTYVSRGWVRTAGARRQRLYAVEDLERLRARHDARAGHGPVAAGALRWGEAVLQTRVSQVTPEGPRYRGHAALALVRVGTPFEAVAELLWGATLDASPWAPLDPAWGSLAALLPPRAPVLPTLLAGLALRALDPEAPDDGPSVARDALRGMARLLGRSFGHEQSMDTTYQQRSIASMACISFGIKPLPLAVAALDRCLVLVADHELNAGTFAARVAASAGAGLRASMVAALAAMTGPRHGAASDALEALLGAHATPEGAREAALGEHARGGSLAGFGHPLYPRGDPRGAELLGLAAELGDGGAAGAALRAVSEALAGVGHPAPNLDAGLVALRAALGLPRGAGAGLFALGRGAGWAAHVFEQRADGALLRPRARYVE